MCYRYISYDDFFREGKLERDFEKTIQHRCRRSFQLRLFCDDAEEEALSFPGGIRFSSFPVFLFLKANLSPMGRSRVRARGTYGSSGTCRYCDFDFELPAALRGSSFVWDLFPPLCVMVGLLVGLFGFFYFITKIELWSWGFSRCCCMLGGF
jgi:hypothetical protein